MLAKFVISYLFYFVSLYQFFCFIYPPGCFGVLYSCGALSFESSHWLSLPGTWSASESTSIWTQLCGVLFGPLYLPGLATPFAAIVICQLLSKTVLVAFPSCLFVYSIPDVLSNVHLTTLLYQYVLSINLCHSLCNWVLFPDPWQVVLNSVQFKIIWIAIQFLRYNHCKAALQEIKFLQYIYILQKLNIFNLWKKLVDSVLRFGFLRGVGIFSSQVFGQVVLKSN